MQRTTEMEEETAQTTNEPAAETDQEQETAQTSQAPARNDRFRYCKDCHHWPQIKERARVSKLLNDAILKYEERLNDKGFKPTVAEFIKLLQLEREIEGEVMDEEMKVKWSEETPESQPEK